MRRFEEFKAIVEEEETAERKGRCILFEEMMEVTEKATALLVEPLMEKKDERWMEYDSVLGEIAKEYSTAGFINGFLAATRLLKEAALI